MNFLGFAWSNFRSNIGSSSTRLVMVTQGLLALLLLTLTMASASIQNHLSNNLETLLGADVVLETERPLDADDLQRLSASSAEFSQTFIVPITLTNGENWQRVELKVVDRQYPIQGRVSLSQSAGEEIYTAERPPAPGEIWVDTRVASHLGLAVGSTAWIGEESYRVAAILRHEPDRILEGHSIKMRAIIAADANEQALLSSGLAKFRYLVAADAAQRSDLTRWSENLDQPINFIDRHAGGHPFAASWGRIENFLGLTFVLLFFMASIAISLASRPKLAAAKNRLSLLLSMGLSHRQGLLVSFAEWIIEFTLSLVPALILAYLAQLLIQQELAQTLVGIEPTIDAWAVLKSVTLLFFLFLGIQVPMFLELRRVSILSLVRGQTMPRDGWLRAIWIGFSLAVLALAYTDNWLLTGMVIASMMAALALLVSLSILVLKAGAKWGESRSGLLAFVLFVMHNRVMAKSTQIIGLGLSLSLLMSALGLMQDLNATMSSQMRSNNGNLYVSDVATSAVPDLRAWAQETNSTVLELDPFVHATLVRINEMPVETFAIQPSEARTRLERPIRISWSETVPDNNRILRGAFWDRGDPDQGQVSVEDEVMTDLGLEFGDRLTFQVGEEEHTFRAVSSHVFKAGGSSTTFWFRVPTAARQDIAAQTHFMGGVEASTAGWDTLSTLLRRSPELHIVPLREIMERLDATFALVSKATVGFSGIILLLSVLVIIGSVSGFQAEDKKRNALFLSLGLSTRDCMRLTLIEWMITALIASVGSIAGTWLMGWLVYSEQLSLTYEPDIALYLTLTFATIAVVVALGVILARSSMLVSIRQQLHDG